MEGVTFTRAELEVILSGLVKIKWSHDHVGVSRANPSRLANEALLAKVRALLGREL